MLGNAERLREIRSHVDIALVDANLGKHVGFGVQVRQSYDLDPVTITVKPDYDLRRSYRHVTYKIQRDEDPTAKILRVVEKAKEFVEAYKRHKERSREAEVRKQTNKERIRAVAAERFPDFEYGGTAQNGLYFTRESDDCQINLYVNSQDQVMVGEIKFYHGMDIDDALKITSYAA